MRRSASQTQGDKPLTANYLHFNQRPTFLNICWDLQNRVWHRIRNDTGINQFTSVDIKHIVMRNTQLNKIKMYDTVQTVILGHQSTWDNNTAFTDAYNAFATKLDLLKSVAADHINSSKGVTALKKVVQQNTIEQAMILGNVLGALALKTGDTELLMRNIYSQSEWTRGSSLLKINRFKNLLADVVEHEAQLMDYGIDATAIQLFTDKLAQYEALSKQPRLSIVNRKQKTQQIAELFTEIDALLNGQIDRIIKIFKVAAPKFVSTFENARSIVDLKGKRSKFTDNDTPDEPDDGTTEGSSEGPSGF